MSKLDPRPNYNGPLYSWDRLNQVLQANLNRPGEPHAAIDLRNYSMSKEEIISEAEKQGYKVTQTSEYSLRFE